MSVVAEVLRSGQRATAPLVSVVISTRNHAALLPNTIHAVLTQDMVDPIELIVVDNASTDETASVMRWALQWAPRPSTYVRLHRDLGAAGGRNVGIAFAHGAFIAFTDSDCTPSARWLRNALQGFADPQVGIVQGRTVPARTGTPLFEHHIETREIDGHFSTSNVVYRRQALDGRRFDPACWYWEDTDLGWRVRRSGWKSAFAGDAVVAHAVIPLSPLRWMLWPRRYANWPAKAARYPEFRRHLFLRTWVRPLHLLFDLALLGLVLARWRPVGLLLTAPYAVAFARTRGLRGRFPPAKLGAYLAADIVSFCSLVAGSIRYRSLVL